MKISKVFASKVESNNEESKGMNISIMKIQHRDLREKAQKFLIPESHHQSASVLRPNFEVFEGNSVENNSFTGLVMNKNNNGIYQETNNNDPHQQKSIQVIFQLKLKQLII